MGCGAPNRSPAELVHPADGARHRLPAGAEYSGLQPPGGHPVSPQGREGWLPQPFQHIQVIFASDVMARMGGVR